MVGTYTVESGNYNADAADYLGEPHRFVYVPPSCRNSPSRSGQSYLSARPQ